LNPQHSSFWNWMVCLCLPSHSPGVYYQDRFLPGEVRVFFLPWFAAPGLGEGPERP
jgi:hypothetical protein